MNYLLGLKLLFVRIIVLTFLIVISFSNLHSQNKLDSIQHLEEVVVTAKQEKEVIPAQNLTGKELDALNSFSVADAIRYFSGVQLKDYGGVGGLKTVNIRSMGTNQVGVFYNGVQLGNAQNGQVDLGKFSMENIGVISVYNGQKSESLQSARDYASAGTIYITTKKPRFTGDKNVNLRANLKTGSFDLLNTALLMEYKISDNLHFLFNGEWLNSSGKYKVHYRRVFPDTKEIAYDTVATRQNGDINATRLEAALYGYTHYGRWNIHAYTYNSDRGVPGAVINNVWKRGERIQDQNSFIQSNLEQSIASQWDLQLKIKYASDYTHFEYFEETLYPVNNKFRQKEFYTSLSNRYDLSENWDVSLAYDFQWNTLDADFQRNDDYDVFPYPARYSHWIAFSTFYNYKKLKLQASALVTHINEKTKQFAEPDDKTVFSPGLFASFKLLNNQELYMNVFYKKAFRMATFNEMYYVEMLSANINPEFTEQYNIGFNYIKQLRHSFFNTIEAKIDAYYNEIKDKIICTPKSPMFKWTTYNLGRVEIRGIDATVSNTYRINKIDLFTRLQYTYQKAQDFTNGSDTFYGDQIPYIPWHSGTIVTGCMYKRWTLNYSFIYTGERYSQSDNIIYNHVQPWYTHDMSIIKDFRINDINMKATLEINNIFDQDYEVVLNYPMPKRNFRVSLVINI